MSVITVPVAAQPTARPRATSALRRVRHQLHYDLLVLVRNREARFFTIALPVLMLVLFAAIFGNESFEVGGRTYPGSTYYVANQLVFGIVDAGLMTTAVAIVGFREAGILKRRRATPQPAWVVVASRALVGILGASALFAVLLAVGVVGYGVELPLRVVPALVLTLAVGGFACCALGFAASTAIRRIESATPTVMAMTLPLFFVSGVFVPWFLVPEWLQGVALVFPVRHLAAATTEALTSNGGAAIRWADLAVVALWGVAGLAIAVRRFRWEKQGS